MADGDSAAPAAPTATTPVRAFVGILTGTKTKVTAGLPNLEDKLTTALAQDALDKRQAVLAKLVGMIAEADKKLKELDRPDEVKLGRNKKPIPGGESYTKGRLEEIEKAEQQLKKLNDALDNAVGAGYDYQKAAELTGLPLK